MNRPYSISFHPCPGKGELVVLFCGSEKTLPRHNVGPQVRDYYLMHLVLSGKGQFLCMGQKYELREGESFFIFPGELIRYMADEKDPWHYRWIGFYGDGAERILATLRLSPQQPIARPNSSKRAAVLLRKIERSLSVAEPGMDLHIGGLMRMLLAHFAMDDVNPAKEEMGRTSLIEQQVASTIRWLTVHYSQPISMEQISHSLGYDRTYLSKMFKQRTGMPPTRFLTKIRLERAKILLKQQRLTVEQIAASVGISDPFYFSKQFKKWYGVPPTQYRKESAIR
ncbi:AraC family transcriptional regulator [Cohnella sp. REN36]|uniref:AraC family transcriptional regulator n=1 Tax=Cohnella sp. REN36 TaxID=2887347 RepID=UPI001D14B5B7|nr:AraC family transcriptional regulator [Cohnella sp. REN36]MCC3372316.1 AraC family transcriptional regulator [Cohnella sp. REN36]